MLFLGVVLLIIAFVAKIQILYVVGGILALVGLVLLLAGARRGSPYGGRYYY